MQKKKKTKNKSCLVSHSYLYPCSSIVPLLYNKETKNNKKKNESARIEAIMLEPACFAQNIVVYGRNS